MIRREQAQGGQAGSGTGHEHPAHSESRGLRRGVHTSHAAEGDEIEPARIRTRQREHPADRIGHVGIHQPHRGCGCRLRVQAERGAQPSERSGGRRTIEPHPPTGEPLRVDSAQHEVGIGHGGFRPAPAVADGPRLGPGGLGPDWRTPASTQAIDPPPAPTEGMSTMGMPMQ